MPEVITNELNSNDNLDSLIRLLSNIQPNNNDLSTDQPRRSGRQIRNVPDNTNINSEDLNRQVQLELLKGLKSINDKVTNLQASLDSVNQELSGMKNDIADNKRMTDGNIIKIDNLRKENKVLHNKINDLEVRSRSNTLILAGPLVRIDNRQSPDELINQSIINVKDVYNFNLDKNDISDCQRFRGKNDSILLSFKNYQAKNNLISSVIRKNKSGGVNLNINEYLSSYNADLLFKLRTLRKKYKTKIFSCFSRNGLIFYKARKNSRPKKIISEDDIEAMTNELQTHGFLRQDQNAPNERQASQNAPDELN